MTDSRFRIEGGCHCGAIRFAVHTAELQALDCDCSICRKKGSLRLVVSADELEVLSGSDSLTDYQFNTRIAHHLSCSTCGMHPYYTPRSHPDGFSVNVRCLDNPWPRRFEVVPFDRENREENIEHIR